MLIPTQLPQGWVDFEHIWQTFTVVVTNLNDAASDAIDGVVVHRHREDTGGHRNPILRNTPASKLVQQPNQRHSHKYATVMDILKSQAEMILAANRYNVTFPMKQRC